MTGSYTRKAFASCPICGKRMYHTRKEARRIARTFESGGGRLNAYPSCLRVKNDSAGEYWHLGHLPNPVRKGTIPRGNLGLAQPPGE